MRRLASCGFLILSCMLSACVTLMPTAEKPYTLGAGLASAPVASWRWQDVRGPLQTDNRSTQDGVIFGEAVLKPSSFEFIQAEFARAVAAHESSAELREKLKGKTVRLIEFEASAGLWVRLSERQQGNWDVMRAKVVVEIDGQRYQSLDTHKFSNSNQPSPLSPAMRDCLSSLANQIFLF